MNCSSEGVKSAISSDSLSNTPTPLCHEAGPIGEATGHSALPTKRTLRSGRRKTDSNE
ncbi:hypothetical protein [Novipirellula galeiformis]|uniref:hypothetical protein n=1 Tax=Novipirellula galeiformis TaxID=2528004 RepID=UPI0018CDE0E2|nr:hypothetical protein [Novipirellula galeiformis]